MGEIKFKVNMEVDTPNGPGVIQGRMEEQGQTLIMVFHDVRNPRVSESIELDFLPGVLIRQLYPVAQIKALR